VLIITRVKTILICFVLLSASYKVCAQENSESLIDLEFTKIQQEFQETEPAGEQAIPQSKLLEELQKPGNEVLLEQLRNGKLKIDDTFDPDQNIDEIKKISGQEDEEAEVDELTDDDDKKLKVATSLEKYFDKNEYFESIRDFYGYKIFLQDPEEARKNRAKVDLYAPRNTNHIIGPGDGFLLTVWGDAEFQRRLVVSGEGTVYIENVGVITVHGLSLDEFEKKLKKRPVPKIQNY